VTATSASDVYYDPYDYAIDDNPHPVWRRLRDEAPVYYNDKLDFYALSRYDDVLRAHLDTDTFSSAKGDMLETIKASLEGVPPMQIMIYMDPPMHTAMRKLSSRGFTRGRITGLEPKIRAIVTEILDEFVGAGSFDYVEQFGAHLPPRVICELVGIPGQHYTLVRAWMDAITFLPEGETSQGVGPGEVAMAEFQAYIADLAAVRRAHPQEDLLSVLVEAELDLPDGTARPLTDAELVEYIVLIAGAGSETVARFLGNAATLLALHPDQRRLLVEQPAVIEAAVEEILRYEAPSPIQARYVTRDVTFHDTVLPAGSRAALLTASAGRDDRKFPDADHFDVGRVASHHLTFGWGIHFCLGAALARLEARIALEETLARFPNWEVDVTGLKRIHTSTVRGYSNVPITF
jgi:cytochrome P450